MKIEICGNTKIKRNIDKGIVVNITNLEFSRDLETVRIFYETGKYVKSMVLTVETCVDIGFINPQCLEKIIKS